MASTAPIGGVRDVTPSRALQLGGSNIHNPSLQTVGIDADITEWHPVPGGLHVVTLTAGRQFTIDDTSNPLPYDLKIGEGFKFWVQNVSGGAFTCTVAVGGNVSAGAGTLTATQNNTRGYILTRTGALTHVLNTVGAGAH